MIVYKWYIFTHNILDRNIIFIPTLPQHQLNDKQPIVVTSLYGCKFFNNIYYSGHPNGGRPMPYCLALPALPYPRQFKILLRIFLIMEEPFHPASDGEHGRRGKTTCTILAGTTTFLLTRRPLISSNSFVFANSGVTKFSAPVTLTCTPSAEEVKRTCCT